MQKAFQGHDVCFTQAIEQVRRPRAGQWWRFSGGGSVLILCAGCAKESFTKTSSLSGAGAAQLFNR